MADNRYVIEYAKSGRSTCKDTKCKEKIDKDVLRIGKVTKNFRDESGDSEMTLWYHAACAFNTLKRARATTKKIEDAGDLDGFEDLKKSDQKTIRDLIEGGGDDESSGKKGTKRKAASKKKDSKEKKEGKEKKRRAKKKDDDDDDDEDEDERPAKKRKSSEKKSSRAAKDSGGGGGGGGGGAKTYLEAPSSTGGKFWECQVEGSEVVTRWGRVGTGGTVKRTECASAAAAQKEADKQIRAKERGGYAPT